MSLGRVSKYVERSVANQISWQCGIYLRLSREDGDKLESDSIANQRKIIDRYLEKYPELEIYDTYIDDGYTGTNFNRPNMTRLLEDIKSRKVNCLIVKDLSRFGRNYHETGRYLEVVFPLLKLRFISVNDNIDSYSNPQSIKNSTVSFKNVMNDEYARDISSKIRSSFNAKRKHGDYIGSVALYGYLKDPNDHHKLIIDEEAAENVRLIFRLFLDGLSIYNIALKLKELGILNPTDYKTSKGINNNNKLKFKRENTGWSTQTIRRMLKNPMYIGTMVQGTHQTISHKVRKCIAVPKENYIIKEGTHEPIIDNETFDKVQERFKHDTWQHKGLGEQVKNDLETGAIYVGYIRCHECGRAMQRTGCMDKNNPLYYFVCGSYLQWKECSRHAIRVKKLNEIVLEAIKKYVSLGLELESILQTIKDKKFDNIAVIELRREIAECEKQREQALKFQNELYIDLKSEMISREQYMIFKREYTEKISILDARIKMLQEKIEESSLECINKNNLFMDLKKYENITTLSRAVIVDLVEMIYIYNDGGVSIKFNFHDEFARAVKIVESYTDIETVAKFKSI